MVPSLIRIGWRSASVANLNTSSDAEREQISLGTKLNSKQTPASVWGESCHIVGAAGLEFIVRTAVSSVDETHKLRCNISMVVLVQE